MTTTMDRTTTPGAPEPDGEVRPKRPRRAAKAKPPARIRKKAPAPAGPPGSAESTATVLSTAFTMVAIVCLWVAVQLLFLSSVSQTRAQDLLYDSFRHDLGGATAPVGPTVPVGDPVAALSIPSGGATK